LISGKPAPAPAPGQAPKLLALSPNAWLLLTITTVNSMALTGVGSLLNPYLRNLGMSAAFVGAYFAVSALVQGLAAFSGGFLADRFGRRRIWMMGKALQIGAYLLLAAGMAGPAVLVVAVLTGWSQMSVGAVSAMQADASEPAWRATFFAVIQTANAVTAAAAPLLGGLLADAYGARWAFAGVVPMLALVAMMIRQLDERPRRASPHRSAPGVTGRTQMPGTAWARFGGLAAGVLKGAFPRTAVALLGHMSLSGITNGLFSITLPMMLRDRFGLGYAGIGGAQTALMLGAALTMIVGARLADRHGRRRIMLASMTCGALLACTMPFITTSAGFYLLIFSFGLSVNASSGAFSATSMEAVREDFRASYGGMLQGLSAGGMALGNLLGGLAYTIDAMLPVYAVMVLLAATILLLFAFLEETGPLAAKHGGPGQSAAAAASRE